VSAQGEAAPRPGPSLGPGLLPTYNDIVRAVAAETGMGLLDLEAIFEQQKPRRLIAKDGIHFNPAGCRLTANAVAARIAEHYLD
jgi:lysophospholipase L1-like esterase